MRSQILRGIPPCPGLAANDRQGAQLAQLVGVLPTLFGLLGNPATQRSAGALLVFPLLDMDGDPIQARLPGKLVGSADPDPEDPTQALYQNRVEASAESMAIYGQVEYDLSDLMALTVGLRYTEDERTAQRFYDLRDRGGSRKQAPTRGAACVDEPNVMPDCNGAVNRAASSDNLDYSVTLDYQLAEDTTVYARYATGYKAAGVDRRSLRFVEFEDEQLETLELGYKSRFWNQTAQLYAAAFISEYDDRQTTFSDPAADAQVTDTLTINSQDTVDLSGFEVEFSWLPLAGLQLGLNYTYLIMISRGRMWT